jgi:branched-chain amino acid transport system substrate-binding protein
MLKIATLTTLFLGWTLTSAVAKEKVAFLAGFTSTSPQTVLTDINFEKGLNTFKSIYPDAVAALDFIKFDNQGEAAGTVFAMKKIHEKGIRFILGISKSNQALIATPFVEEFKMLFITPFATNDLVTRDRPHVFRTCYSDSTQGDVLARFAVKELKARNIVILTNADTSYSLGLAARFTETVGSAAKVSEVRYVPESVDFEQIKKRLLQLKPELVFIPDYVDTATGLAEQVHAALPKAVLLGSDGWGGREILDSALVPLPKLVAYYATPWIPELKTPENEKFVRAFTKLQGQPPTSVGPALMHDAAKVFWEAYQKAAAPKTPESVKRALLTNTFQTTTGPVSYPDESDLTPKKTVVIIRLGAGKHEFYKAY